MYVQVEDVLPRCLAVLLDYAYSVGFGGFLTAAAILLVTMWDAPRRSSGVSKMSK